MIIFLLKFCQFFLQAEEKRIEIVTSTISYIEVLVPVLKLNNTSLEAKYNYVFKEFFTTIDIDLDIARKGAFLKSQYNLKTPDALQLSFAVVSSCEKFFTSDKQLLRVKEIQIEVIA